MIGLRIQKKLSFFFFFLLVAWISISFTRLLYNVIRIGSEEKKWIQYNDSQKREELYGDVYDVIQYINMHSSSVKSILIISEDGKPYFVSRYVLYPRLVYWDKLESHILENLGNYSLVVRYHPKETNRNVNISE
jgi:hypothetical protein